MVLLRWAAQLGSDRRWAIEDCRHVSRRLERDLLAAGEQIVRVAPKLMAHVCDSARTYGKSDPIDALAVARAALREPGLPTARLAGRRPGPLQRLRRGGGPPGRRPRPTRLVARLGRSLVQHLRRLTVEIDQIHADIQARVQLLATTLLAVVGVGPLTAAKILGETAGVDRFASKDAFARFNGPAPMPVWSSTWARHQLSRTGSRQLNAALHRMALIQVRVHPPAKAMIERCRAGGDAGMETLRVLKRRLSDVAYQALRADLVIKAKRSAA